MKNKNYTIKKQLVFGFYFFLLSGFAFAQEPTNTELTKTNSDNENITNKQNLNNEIEQILNSSKIENSEPKSASKSEAKKKKKEKVLSPLEIDANFYLDSIKSNNPSSPYRLGLRTGFMQIVGNIESIRFNEQSTMPFYGLEIVSDVIGKLGIEARGYYAKNSLYPPVDEINGSDVFQSSYDVGLRYTYEIDPTRKGNYFAFKVLYHNTENNFALEDPAEQIIVNSYSGILLGIEKAQPITRSLSLDASLDFILLNQVEGPSQLSMKDSGFALQVKGEAYYLVDWFKLRSRLGIAYWQGSFNNDLEEDAIETKLRKSHVQTYRSISFSYTLLF